jgi:GNAT superfamily N-acetyltransferase
MDPPRHPELDVVLREEREFVLAFGGYALQIPGGTLVLNERIPVPRFNFVQDVRVGRERMSAFFEKALDHYFQRALRPAFDVATPAPAFLVPILARYGFRLRPEPRSVLLTHRTVPAAPATDEFKVRPAASEELDTVCDFWAGTTEREEVRRSLEVLIAHPNPDERLIPLLAFEGRDVRSAAILYAHRGAWGIHAVATQPPGRGRGAATAIVAHALSEIIPASSQPIAIWADHGRIRRRLEGLGFHEIARFDHFELDPRAELTLPPLGPPQGPRWRPPRAPEDARTDR